MPAVSVSKARAVENIITIANILRASSAWTLCFFRAKNADSIRLSDAYQKALIWIMDSNQSKYVHRVWEHLIYRETLTKLSGQTIKRFVNNSFTIWFLVCWQRQDESANMVKKTSFTSMELPLVALGHRLFKKQMTCFATAEICFMHCDMHIFLARSLFLDIYICTWSRYIWCLLSRTWYGFCST